MCNKKILLVVSLIIVLISTITLSACKNSTKTSGQLVVDYDVKCSLDDESKAMYLNCTINLTNGTNQSIKELPFYLYPNAYKEEGGNVTISNVSTRARDLIYNIEGINMLVSLGEEMLPNESEEITISGRISLPKGNGRIGYGEDYYNLHAFFPRLAYFERDRFVVVPYSKIGDPYYWGQDDVVIKINYPLEFQLAHSGEVISTNENEKYAESVINIDNARDVALTLVKNYNLYKNEVNGVRILQYSKEGEDYTQYMKECLQYFISEIGEYPYSVFTMAETPFDYGGMEYSGFILVNEKAKEKEYVIAHEIIHQWFGIAIGSNSFEECWVDESLTNFLTYYYMGIYNKGDHNEIIEKEKEIYKTYIENGKEKYGTGYAPRLDAKLNEFRTMSEYSNMVYGYGAIMYDGIYKVIGDKKFKKAVKDYYKKYNGKVVSGQELQATFSKSVGKKVEGIFNGYIENKVLF